MSNSNTPTLDPFVSREAYERLLHENKLLRSIIDQLPSELVVVDPDNKFLLANKAAVKDDEIREWMIGKTDYEFWQRKNKASELSRKRLACCAKAIEQKSDYSIEEVFHEGTEQEKHYIRLHRPLFLNEALSFILVYGQDITELKKSEGRLMLQNVELEKVNHELDQFVYSASHNLRAPLLSMKGLMQLLEQDDTSDASRKQYIGEAFKSIDRLDATIKDIIDYSKNARLELAPVPIDWRNLIQSTFDDLRFYEERPIELVLKIEDSGDFLSDERRLKSIFHNIISNSIKYNDSGKDKSWLNIVISCGPDKCICTFTDNGKGISKQNQERVFEMFYRATSDGSGSGLGLYIAKEMTERIGGKIELQSTPGEGTEIRVTLPNLGQ